MDRSVLVRYVVKYLSFLAMVGSVLFGVAYFNGMAEVPYAIVIAICLFVASMYVFTGTFQDTAKRDKVRKLLCGFIVFLLIFLNVFRSMFWLA